MLFTLWLGLGPARFTLTVELTGGEFALRAEPISIKIHSMRS